MSVRNFEEHSCIYGWEARLPVVDSNERRTFLEEDHQ